MCSYNNDGNTVLHLALESKCEASIVSLLDVMCNIALMLTAFIHENKQGKTPLELAIETRHECSSNELVFKFLEKTLLSGYACEDIFVNNMDSIVVFDSAREGVSMFALFIRNSCDASLHYHKIRYEHCGRMIELESHEDCEKSIERKQALVCKEYEDKLYRKIEDEEKDKSTRADAAIRKQRAKQAILKIRISKQLEQVELKEQQKVRQGNRTPGRTCRQKAVACTE